MTKSNFSPAARQSAPSSADAVTPDHAWVHEVLEPQQLSASKPRFERRTMGGSLLLLLWGLRIYVVVMILLIGYQVWNAFHAKA